MDVIPENVESAIKAGEELLTQRIRKVRIADELGWDGLAKFEKEELAENADEEKRLKQICKEFGEIKDRGVSNGLTIKKCLVSGS